MSVVSAAAIGPRSSEDEKTKSPPSDEQDTPVSIDQTQLDDLETLNWILNVFNLPI